MKNRIFIIIIIFIGFSSNLFAQQSCEVESSKIINAQIIDKNDIICIAKNSDKPYTIFYTLASWCAPCRLHFPDAFELQKSEKIDLFVVLVEAEKDPRVNNAINFIRSYSENIKFGILKDSFYGTKTKRRNSKFATEITPKHNELIEDYGKFILIDKNGNILYVTNWKDYNKDWKNSKKMLESKILPLIK